MARFREVATRRLIGTDEQTRRWMSRARTAATRAEIRRWAWWEGLSAWLMIAGMVLVFAIPLLVIALVI